MISSVIPKWKSEDIRQSLTIPRKKEKEFYENADILKKILVRGKRNFDRNRDQAIQKMEWFAENGLKDKFLSEIYDVDIYIKTLRNLEDYLDKPKTAARETPKKKKRSVSVKQPKKISEPKIKTGMNEEQIKKSQDIVGALEILAGYKETELGKDIDDETYASLNKTKDKIFEMLAEGVAYDEGYINSARTLLQEKYTTFIKPKTATLSEDEKKNHFDYWRQFGFTDSLGIIFIGNKPYAPAPENDDYFRGTASFKRDTGLTEGYLTSMNENKYQDHKPLDRAPIISARHETPTDSLFTDLDKVEKIIRKGTLDTLTGKYKDENDNEITSEFRDVPLKPLEFTEQIKRDLRYKKDESDFREKLSFILTNFVVLDPYQKKELRDEFPYIFDYWMATCISRINEYAGAARWILHPPSTREDFDKLYRMMSPDYEFPLNNLGMKVIEFLLGWKSVVGGSDTIAKDKETRYQPGFIRRRLESNVSGDRRYITGEDRRIIT